MKKNSVKTNLNFNLKTLVIILFLGVGLYLLIPQLINEKEVFSLLLKVKKPYLFLALIFEIASYLGAAGIMGVTLSRMGYHLPLVDRFRLGSIGAFAIHFFPVSGWGEAAVDFYFLKKRKVSSGSIILMFILRSIIVYSAFLILFVLTLLTVPTFPNLSFSPKIISLILFLLISFSIFYLLVLFKNKTRFCKFLLKISGFINKFMVLIKRPPINEEKINEVYHDISRGIHLFAHKKRAFIKAVAMGLVYWLGDLTCLYLVVLSFGYKPHFFVIMFAYCISVLLSQLSLIPGGLGVSEGSLSLIFRSVNIPLSLSIASVLVFRFFSFWIWIPIGLISYFTLKRKYTRLNL